MTGIRPPWELARKLLAFCGMLGLGRLRAEGEREALDSLRPFASDPRWRIREAVVMTLQRLGAMDMDAVLAEMEEWSRGILLEQRGAAAALCHPDLLQDKEPIERVLQILDAITGSLASADERKSVEFKALRKGLGYCWSVAVSALPSAGIELMERWLPTDDQDVRWIMKQNLNRKRPVRVDAEWVAPWKSQLNK